MKTAISIPDELFGEADELAEELGMSRSELYSQAVREYLARRRGSEMTRRLDEVYSRTDARLDPVLEALQQATLEDDGE